MTQPIVLLTSDELASHTSANSYKWTKGAICGDWLVLIAPNVNGVSHAGREEYGYKEYAGMDRGGLWFENGKLVDEDGHEDVIAYNFHFHEDDTTARLNVVGKMLEALGMDVQSYLE